MASHPLWPALALIFLLTALRLTGTVDSDVSWQLWIAGRIHAGADLYRDIIETNPPLWFWMALPVDSAASLLEVRSEGVIIVTAGCAVALSLSATARLINHIPPRQRTLLLGYGALTLAGMPWMHIGQREQIVLVGTIPYAALIAARRERRPVSPLLAALVGAGAALGFALKHYFLIVPTLLELWFILGERRHWRALRPESIAVVSVGAAYAAALALLEPDFLTSIVPLLNLAYGDFGAPALRYLFGPLAVVGVATLALALAHGKFMLRGRAPFAAALLLAGVGFAAAYFIQFKGWRYHSMAFLGCGSLSLAALLAESGARTRALRFLAPAVLALPLFMAAQEGLHPDVPGPDLEQALSGVRRGDTMGFITVETAIPWSVTLQRGYRYASRNIGFWMMPAIIRNERIGSPDPRLTRLGKQIVADTVEDFSCTPPKRIIVARPRPGEDGFDILPFFLRNPNFAALLSHYRVVSRTTIETYEIVSPLPPPRGPCRHGV
jgi:hypothetical protein